MTVSCLANSNGQQCPPTVFRACLVAGISVSRTQSSVKMRVVVKLVGESSVYAVPVESPQIAHTAVFRFIHTGLCRGLVPKALCCGLGKSLSKLFVATSLERCRNTDLYARIKRDLIIQKDMTNSKILTIWRKEHGSSTVLYVLYVSISLCNSKGQDAL
jgi:hypothetical protein